MEAATQEQGVADGNEITKLKADLAEAVEALRPMANGAFGLDGKDRNDAEIWEHSSAMNITIGDLRRAAAIVEKHK